MRDERFDLAEHVVRAPVERPLDEPALLALVAELFEQRLDRSRPLWRIDVAELADGGSALIWRIHHALADGTASVRYARALLWDASAEASMTATQAHAAHVVDERRRRAHLAGFLRREYARGSAARRSTGASARVARSPSPRSRCPHCTTPRWGSTGRR